MENGDINRLVSIMAEMLDEQRLTRKEITQLRVEFKNEITQLRVEFKDEMNSLQTETEGGFASLNLAVGELRLSVMKLATELEALHDHENRIVKIEKVVFK